MALSPLAYPSFGELPQIVLSQIVSQVTDLRERISLSLVNRSFYDAYTAPEAWERLSINLCSDISLYTGDPQVPDSFRLNPGFYRNLLSRFGQFVKRLRLVIIVPTLSQPGFSADMWRFLQFVAYEREDIFSRLEALELYFKPIYTPQIPRLQEPVVVDGMSAARVAIVCYEALFEFLRKSLSLVSVSFSLWPYERVNLFSRLPHLLAISTSRFIPFAAAANSPCIGLGKLERFDAMHRDLFGPSAARFHEPVRQLAGLQLERDALALFYQKLSHLTALSVPIILLPEELFELLFNSCPFLELLTLGISEIYFRQRADRGVKSMRPESLELLGQRGARSSYNSLAPHSRYSDYCTRCEQLRRECCEWKATDARVKLQLVFLDRVAPEHRFCFYEPALRVTGVSFLKSADIRDEDVDRIARAFPDTLERFSCFSESTEVTVSGRTVEALVSACGALVELCWFSFVGYQTVIRLASLRGDRWRRFEIGRRGVELVHESDLRVGHVPQLFYLTPSVAYEGSDSDANEAAQVSLADLKKDRYLLTCARVTRALQQHPTEATRDANISGSEGRLRHYNHPIWKLAETAEESYD